MRATSTILTALATAAALTLPATPAEAAAAKVQITKIWYDSPGSPDNGANSSLNGEYAQIKNVTKRSVSLKGWTLRDKTSASDHVYTFGTFTLGAGKTVTVYTGEGTNTSAKRFWNRSGGTFAYIWNQSKDTGYLRDAQGNPVDSCSYNSSRADYINC